MEWFLSNQNFVNKSVSIKTSVIAFGDSWCDSKILAIVSGFISGGCPLLPTHFGRSYLVLFGRGSVDSTWVANQTRVACESYEYVLTNMCGGKVYRQPRMSNPVRRACELNNRSPVLNELRDLWIVLPSYWLDCLVKSLG